ELRNRIYHLAQEATFDADEFELPPLLAKQTTTATKKITSSRNTGRKFFSLTQTCKHIRSEYRPIWLRNSTIRLDFNDLEAFIRTYYPNVDDYCNAPKLLAIAWDHDKMKEEDILLDIAPLFRLRAFCSTFVATFVCRRLLDGDLPNAVCEECGHSLRCGCETYCDHSDALEDIFAGLFWAYGCMKDLNQLLANPNDCWLQTLRDAAKHETMEIECTIDVDEQRLVVYIRFQKDEGPPLLSKETLYSGAIRYLEQMGFLTMKNRENFDFILGVETGKFTTRDGDNLVPTYNQIEVPGNVEAE
ncbi:hypothetical protein EK21DRAFT_60054, partial [Setomelanomma holmii]